MRYKGRFLPILAFLAIPSVFALSFPTMDFNGLARMMGNLWNLLGSMFSFQYVSKNPAIMQGIMNFLIFILVLRVVQVLCKKYVGFAKDDNKTSAIIGFVVAAITVIFTPNTGIFASIIALLVPILILGGLVYWSFKKEMREGGLNNFLGVIIMLAALFICAFMIQVFTTWKTLGPQYVNDFVLTMLDFFMMVLAILFLVRIIMIFFGAGSGSSSTSSSSPSTSPSSSSNPSAPAGPPILADGSQYLPDGSLLRPDGSIVRPNNTVVPPIGGSATGDGATPDVTAPVPPGADPRTWRPYTVSGIRFTHEGERQLRIDWNSVTAEEPFIDRYIVEYKYGDKLYRTLRPWKWANVPFGWQFAGERPGGEPFYTGQFELDRRIKFRVTAIGKNHTKGTPGEGTWDRLIEPTDPTGLFNAQVPLEKEYDNIMNDYGKLQEPLTHVRSDLHDLQRVREKFCNPPHSTHLENRGITDRMRALGETAFNPNLDRRFSLRYNPSGNFIGTTIDVVNELRKNFVIDYWKTWREMQMLEMRAVQFINRPDYPKLDEQRRLQVERLIASSITSFATSLTDLQQEYNQIPIDPADSGEIA